MRKTIKHKNARCFIYNMIQNVKCIFKFMVSNCLPILIEYTSSIS